jgi:hypothetical protein
MLEFGFTVPLKVAEPPVTPPPEPVVTVGVAAVETTSLAPVTVPDALVATSRKAYVCPGFNPETTAETCVAAEPAPASTDGVVRVGEPAAPYSK